MGQLIKRLSDRAVQNASPKGRISRFLPDGAGLYLQVSPTGTKSWVFRYSVKGRERYMGLGPFPDVSLADARAVANDCRKLRRQNIDPIDHRTGQRAEALLASAATKTFRDPPEFCDQRPEHDERDPDRYHVSVERFEPTARGHGRCDHWVPHGPMNAGFLQFGITCQVWSRSWTKP
jgi:hypothetical protein